MNETTDSNPSPAEKFRNRKTVWKGTFYVLVILLLAGGVFYFTQYRDVPLRASPEVTIVTEPVNSKGQVDFLRAFEQVNFSDAIASDQNGFRAIVENTNFFEDTPGPHFEIVCKKLGLDPEKVKPKFEYVDPNSFAIEYHKSGQFDKKTVREIELELGDSLMVAKKNEGDDYQDWDVAEILFTRSAGPWNGQDMPMLEQWVQQVSPALDLYAEAVRAPRFEIPFSRDDESKSMVENLGYHIHVTRSVARGYMSRANYYLGSGQIRKAMDDVVSCKRLGRHIRNRNTMVDRLLGIAIEGIADSIGIVDVDDDKTTAEKTNAEDLAYLAKELQSLPKLNDLDQSYYFEKLANMDWIQHGADRDPDKWVRESDNAKYLRNLGLDWNIVVAEYNKQFDLQLNEPKRGRSADVKITTRDLISRSARSRKFAQWYTSSNGLSAALNAEHRIECSDQLRLITLAMLRYEKEQGTLPPAFTTDQNGKPMHSWRVLLLPYLGEQELFDKVRLNESWDSPHNSAFHDQCPDMLTCPSCQDCTRQTSYSVIVGEGLAFEGGDGKTLAEFGPHSNDMILVAERTKPVDWMDPTKEIEKSEAEKGINVDYDQKKAKVAIGSPHSSGSLFGFRNGAVIFLSQHHEKEFLKAQIEGNNRRFIPY